MVVVLWHAECLTLFLNKSWFLLVCSISLWKTLWEKEKLLVTSNFSFSHNCRCNQTWNCCLQTLSVWKSLEFVFGKGLKMVTSYVPCQPAQTADWRESILFVIAWNPFALFKEYVSDVLHKTALENTIEKEAVASYKEIIHNPTCFMYRVSSMNQSRTKPNFKLDDILWYTLVKNSNLLVKWRFCVTFKNYISCF